MNTCAASSRAVAEPLAGTAATARTWLLLEQPGPWGARALTQSRLDPAVGRALEDAAEGTGVRVALIRRPGRHADHPGLGRRRAYLAHTGPGRSWIRATASADPRALPELDFAALAAGEHGGRWEPHRGAPLVLVCTNGKRDRCCALLGRPLAADLAADGGTDVWEITHLGGHRFAPTLLVLPHGYAYGRMTTVAMKAVLHDLQDGLVTVDGARGRSTWDRPGQTAELAVRRLTGERAADAFAVETAATAPGWSVRVIHRDGRGWTVRVTEGACHPPSPASCGAPQLAQSRMDVVSVTADRSTGPSH